MPSSLGLTHTGLAGDTAKCSGFTGSMGAFMGRIVAALAIGLLCGPATEELLHTVLVTYLAAGLSYAGSYQGQTHRGRDVVHGVAFVGVTDRSLLYRPRAA